MFERFDERHACLHGPAGIILVGLGKSKVGHQALPQRLDHIPAKARDDRRTRGVIGTEHGVQGFWLEAYGQCGRLDQVTHQHRQLTVPRGAEIRLQDHRGFLERRRSGLRLQAGRDCNGGRSRLLGRRLCHGEGDGKRHLGRRRWQHRAVLFYHTDKPIAVPVARLDEALGSATIANRCRTRRMWLSSVASLMNCPGHT